MLRRKPTAITLTSEDVAAYEDSLAQQRTRNLENESSAAAAAAARQSLRGKDGARIDPNDELKPLPGDRARIARGTTITAGAGSSAAEREARIMGR